VLSTNPVAGVTTPVGASKPDAWVAVLDKQTQAQYYWNKESGQREGKFKLLLIIACCLADTGDSLLHMFS
jgi:hypothetical protein